MNIEKFGVRVTAPQLITLEAQSFADLIVFLQLRVENLRRCVVALGLANPHGANETVAEVQVQLQVMIESANGVEQDMMRIAKAQGLRFVQVPRLGEPSVETRATRRAAGRREGGRAAPTRH